MAALLEDASLIIKNEGVIALNLMAAVQDGMCVCGGLHECVYVWRFTCVCMCVCVCLYVWVHALVYACVVSSS